MKATLNGKTAVLNEGDSMSIPKGAKHRVEGIENSIVLEVMRGHWNEEDVIRVSDDYGRVNARVAITGNSARPSPSRD